jgi:glycosyltransferase involved in cell wall biosynthesis
MQKLSYAIISTELRRDLEDPLAYFQHLDVYHFYKHTPMQDMRADDFSHHTIQYRNPAELATRLRECDPDIVQGVEPFALVTQPYIKVICDYIVHHGKPLVVVSLENIPFTLKYGPVAWMLGPLIARYIQLARLIIAINDGARENFLRYAAQPANITRLMYGTWGVNPEEFTPTGPAAELAGEKRRVILFVGRVHKMKGVFDVLEAFRRIAHDIPDTVLVFIGSGAATEELRRRAQHYGLQERVQLLGTVKNRDIASYMRRASLVVAPSVTTWQWKEQVGMVHIQAMACGVPVVSTQSGSIPEFIPHNEAGMLVPERNPAALARAMVSLLTDASLHRQMGARGRAYVLKHYDAQQNVQRAEQEIVRHCASSSYLEDV